MIRFILGYIKTRNINVDLNSHKETQFWSSYLSCADHRYKHNFMKNYTYLYICTYILKF
jgi:hypothetical protein